MFILRGLLDHRKQLVGYFLSNGPIDSERLHSLLLECVDKAEAAGLKVKVVTADQESNKRITFHKVCKVTESGRFSEHNSRKLRVMYAPPPSHLLKNVRNNFIKSGFVVNERDISWHYVEIFLFLCGNRQTEWCVNGPKAK